MDKLNFPTFNCNIRKKEGKVEIYDIIRKKFVVLLPEEWVRQHALHYLVTNLRYPRSLFKVESGLSYNSLSKRSDILIYNKEGDPHFLVECKSYKVPINQKALDQLTLYNKTLNAEFILLTNGINHFCCRFNENKGYEFIDAIPAYHKNGAH